MGEFWAWGWWQESNSEGENIDIKECKVPEELEEALTGMSYLSFKS